MGVDPWVWKIPCRRKWQTTPVFVPGEFHGQRSLVGYRPWGCERVGKDWVTERSAVHLRCLLVAAWISHSLFLLSAPLVLTGPRDVPRPLFPIRGLCSPGAKILLDIVAGARVSLIQAWTHSLGYLYWLLPRNPDVLALTCTQGDMSSVSWIEITLDNQWWWYRSGWGLAKSFEYESFRGDWFSVEGSHYE